MSLSCQKGQRLIPSVQGGREGQEEPLVPRSPGTRGGRDWKSPDGGRSGLGPFFHVQQSFPGPWPLTVMVKVRRVSVLFRGLRMSELEIMGLRSPGFI